MAIGRWKQRLAEAWNFKIATKPQKLRPGTRIALIAAVLGFYPLMGFWAWASGDRVKIAIACFGTFVVLYRAAWLAQAYCDWQIHWNQRLAQESQRSASLRTQRSEANAHSAECVSGERARAYHRRRAKRLAGEAETQSRLATQYQREVRWWRFLR